MAPPRDPPPPPSSSTPSPAAVYSSNLHRHPPPPPPPPRKDNSRHDSYRPLPPPPLPTFAIDAPEEETTTLMLIRETLFAALGDSLATNQDLLSLLERSGDKAWSSRCFFASLSLAILDVCLFRVVLPTLPDMIHISAGIRKSTFPWNEAYVKTVHYSTGQDKVSLENCPMELTKLLSSVFRIGMFVQSLSESDDKRAIEDAGEGKETSEKELYIYRLKRKLLGDVATQSQQSELPGEEYVQEANVMVNRLALGECPWRRSGRERVLVLTESLALQPCLKSLHFDNGRQKRLQYSEPFDQFSRCLSWRAITSSHL